MDRFPETFHRVVGELPEAGRLPSGQEFPFGTLPPVLSTFSVPPAFTIFVAKAPVPAPL